MTNQVYKILQDPFDEEIKSVSHHFAIFSEVVDNDFSQWSHCLSNLESESVIARETAAHKLHLNNWFDCYR